MSNSINENFTQTIASRCIQAAKELSKESMYDKPTDIIGFSDIGQKLAAKLENVVGIKEICYYDVNPTNSEYHYLDFRDMLKLTEYMFITCPCTSEYLALFDDLSNLNPNCKVVIASNGFEDVARKIAKIVGEQNVKIVR